MSFTDLASLAQTQQRPQPPPQGPQPQGDDPGQPPDPRSFSQSPTNPATVAAQVASIDAAGTPGDERDDLGDLTKVDKPKTPDETAADSAYPPVAFAPAIYRPPAANRGPEGWGQEWTPVKMAGSYPGVAPGPDMPSPAESYKELRDTGAALGRWGPPSVAEPASQGAFLMQPFVPILDALSKGNFSRNYSAAALRGLEIRREEGLQKSEQAWRNHQQILQGYGSIFKLAADKAIPYEEATRRIEDYANQIGDQALIQELHRNGLRGAQGWLDWQDAFMRRQMAATTQLRKVAGEDRNQVELDALGGRRPGVGGGGAGALGVDPNALPGRGGPDAPQTPAKEQSEPESPYDQKIISDLGLPPDIGKGVLRAARQRMNGEDQDIATTPGGQADNYIGQAQAALGANIDRISRLQPQPGQDPDELSQQKLEAIRQNNPGVATDIDNLKNLRIDPATFQVAKGQRKRAVTLTSQIYPNWNQGMYHQFQTVWNKEDSRASLGVQALQRAASELVLLEAAVNRTPGGEDASIPANVMQEFKQHMFTGENDYAMMNEPLRTLATDTVVINNMGGRAAVTPVNQLLREAPLYASKRQFRALIHQIASQLDRVGDSVWNAYHTQTGMEGDPPSFGDPRAREIISYVAGQNPNTGKFADQAPAELKAIEPKTQARGLRPDQTYKPMSAEQRRGRINYIEKLRRENPNDPRLPLFLNELGLQE
ncbi:MAG TPA: hypothetical protein VGJ20_20505 [Xanthobacteraceae bacterium]|jgi:hypothetical protein